MEHLKAVARNTVAISSPTFTTLWEQSVVR